MSSERRPLPVSFRLATLRDRDDVFNLCSGVYNGLDYLPFYFEQFVADPRRECYVAEHDGEAVGFAVGFVVNKETTCVVHSARVRESLRGLNVYKHLSRHLKAEIVKKYPTVTQVAFTAASSNPALEKPSFWQGNREIIRRHCFVYTVSPKDLESNVSRVQHLVRDGIKTVSGSMLAQLMASTDEQLFPGNWLVRDWEVFEVMEDNAELITKNAAFWSKQEERVVCLSLINDHVVSAGPLLMFDIYGVHLDAILSHIVLAVQRLIGQATDSDTRDRQVVLSVDSRVDRTPIQTLLTQLGFRDGRRPPCIHLAFTSKIDSASEI